MNIIQNDNMPKAGGHYSMCVEHNGVLYISGQLPFRPEDRIMPKGIEAQTLQTLNNMEAVLKAAGSDRNDVIQARIYMADIKDWEKVNQVYSTFFADHKPARLAVPVGLLHYGALIEIEVTAISH